VREEVPGAVDDALVDDLWQDRAIGIGDRCGWMSEGIVAAVQHDRRRRDRWPRCEAPFVGEKARLARRVEVAVTIRMNHAVDEVGVVPRLRAEGEQLLAEAPRRRPFLPQQPAEFAPVLLQPPATRVGLE